MNDLMISSWYNNRVFFRPDFWQNLFTMFMVDLPAPSPDLVSCLLIIGLFFVQCGATAERRTRGLDFTCSKLACAIWFFFRQGN